MVKIMLRSISGNEAVALAAVNAGASVLTGYPGTPSSEAIGSLWGKRDELEGLTVQWSTNEKVALEIAAAASWAGQRAFCSMKMSGLNVAYDSLISIAYSGCTGALVIYVCDDPGVSAGMPEQDIRGFALMSDLPIIDLGSVEESYTLTQFAFELSERTGTPVLLRSVTNVALSHAALNLPNMHIAAAKPPVLTKDITKFTKAGAKICMDQHRDLIERLEKAGELIEEANINKLDLVPTAKLGIIAGGVMARYINEGIELAKQYFDVGGVSVLNISTPLPLPKQKIAKLISACDAIAVIEENETYIEHGVYLEAYKLKKQIKIVGKEDGTLSRIGSFDALTVAKAVLKLLDKPMPEALELSTGAQTMCTVRPIGVCAGCPHRGTFMSINEAVRLLGYKKDEVMVTGDIGCTILGMSPPFNTLWTEVSMGASLAMAQGFKYSGLKTPVISTIGDSTFLHAGVPALINAVQTNINVTEIIMDNGWTAMTGMQVNAGTQKEFQREESYDRVDIAKIIPALGVKEENFAIVDPYDTEKFVSVLTELIKKDGVKVVLARRECAIQAARRGVKYGQMRVNQEKCVRCKACILKSGCPGLVFADGVVKIDAKLCNGCGICKTLCSFNALELTK